jgi:single-stranded-DNA-specific exonuclease
MTENGRVVTRRWNCAPLDHARQALLARETGVSTVLAGLLLCRGIASVEEARRFLQPDLDHLHDPLLLPDMEVAVTRLVAAIRDGDRILIHGDYDVDGVTATALLTRVLRKLGANVEHFVPHRVDDGYDLRVTTVQAKAAAGVQVIVTVDCGIVAHQAAHCARELGVDLIVTDHHEPGTELPAALAVINPKRKDSVYPFPHLSGVGVAFKLATALVRALGVPEQSFRTQYLDLVGLGTAADCMPLMGENRVFVKFGLETLQQTKKAGLRALLQCAGLDRAKLSASTLGFVLGPRINAVGRLDAAANALELLLTSDVTEARRLAELLERCNQDRRAVQSRIFEQAFEQAQSMPASEAPILVLAAPEWHSGVIGIVASKIVEAFARPTIMIALEGATGRGSARSTDGFNIFQAISACSSLLERCGGHEGAAGLEIAADRVEEFRQSVCRVAADQLGKEMPAPRLDLDAFLEPGELGMGLAHELTRLEPFGHGNPQPLFATRAIRLAQFQVLNSRRPTDPDHLKLFLNANGGSPVEAMYWRNGRKAEELVRDMTLDVCYTLEVNEFRGVQSLRLNVKDLRIAQETA